MIFDHLFIIIVFVTIWIFKCIFNWFSSLIFEQRFCYFFIPCLSLLPIVDYSTLWILLTLRAKVRAHQPMGLTGCPNRRNISDTYLQIFCLLILKPSPMTSLRKSSLVSSPMLLFSCLFAQCYFYFSNFRKSDKNALHGVLLRDFLW